jgi:hypothetical protein
MQDNLDQQARPPTCPVAMPQLVAAQAQARVALLATEHSRALDKALRPVG